MVIQDSRQGLHPIFNEKNKDLVHKFQLELSTIQYVVYSSNFMLLKSLKPVNIWSEEWFY